MYCELCTQLDFALLHWGSVVHTQLSKVVTPGFGAGTGNEKKRRAFGETRNNQHAIRLRRGRLLIRSGRKNHYGEWSR